MWIKNTLPRLVNFDGKKYFEKCNMTSVNLENPLKYLKAPENLRSEKLHRALFLCKGGIS